MEKTAPVEIRLPVLTGKAWLRQYAGLAIGPGLFLLIQTLDTALPLEMTRRVIGVAAWMLFWWITETVSIPVTALMPLVLFPVLGILELKATAAFYANPTIFLFMAGFVFALAMEKHGLHARIALYIVRAVGTETDRLVLGFMIATAFVSLWVNNTAAALLMLPIASSVVNLMEDKFLEFGLHRDFRNFTVSMMLGLAYCASIGGMGTIIGTPTNAVLVEFLRMRYQIDLSFAGWFVVGFPLAVALLLAAYYVLVKWLFPVRVKTIPGAQGILDQKIAELGQITFGEQAVSTLFILTALGWIVRTPLVSWFGLEFLNDTVIGMAGALLLFLLPDSRSKSGYVFDWASMQKMAWGILLLIGGGLALAKALEDSGVIKLIGTQIAASGTHEYFILLAAIVGVALTLKQFIGNVALATLALPMAFGIADAAGIPPILLGAPVTFAASCGYMLPMATPPNAIVFTGLVRISDMLKAGTVLVIMAFGLLLLASEIYQWMV